MVCLFQRFLSADVSLSEAHLHHLSFEISTRIVVVIYKDAPMYRAVYVVDGKEVLSEHLIDSLEEYTCRTKADKNFYSFLISYASALTNHL